MNILLTGGLGFIGSHTAVELLKTEHRVTILDNASNASPAVIDRIKTITGVAPKLILGDIRDEALMTRTLKDEAIDVVIHFAGLKAVGESVQKPLEYFDNNVNGTLVLLRSMRATGVKRLIFSSSATVYGDPQSLPLTETAPLGEVTNPYGRTKKQIEEILADTAIAYPDWSLVCLRYFNPIGAHRSGLIGEDPNGIPNNLLPYVSRVASGRLPALRVFGGDYPTHDGTGVRDFIHVVDLALGHVKAIDYALNHRGWIAINLGTGVGYSVLDVVKAFERASGKPVPYDIVARRPGDIAECWCDPTRAHELLGWKATHTLDDMCRDAWNFERQLVTKDE